MRSKPIFFLSLVSVTIWTSSAQPGSRGPRDYGHEVATSRSGRPTKPLGNRTEGRGLYEPPACAQCLEDRYLTHYLKKGCTPKSGEWVCRKPCPKYFDCPKPKKTSVQHVEGCEHSGKLYSFYESVPMGDPCRPSCTCVPDYDSKNVSHPRISCAIVDCFEDFRAVEPNCYPIYEKGECCPKKFCADGTQAKTKCRFEGKEYRLRQDMHSKVDYCMECVCNEQWNESIPLSENSNCRRRQCTYDGVEEKLREGCIPIYHEKTCCPIDFYCPPPEEHQCKFNGKRYNIGEKLDIGRNDRTECKCIVPPDFTCIEKAFEFQAKSNIESKTTPVPPIRPIQPIQSVPIQFPSSETGESASCPPFVEGGLSCAGLNCTTIIDSNGCQACKCLRNCPQLKCRSGCSLVATTPGVCPECKCV